MAASLSSSLAVVGQDDRGARLGQRPLDARICSLAMAVSSAGSALASRDLNTACAASSARRGRWTISVRPPSAASIAPRSRLLMRTVSRSAGAAPATGSSGRGVGQLVGVVLEVDRLLFGAEQQLAVLQRANDGRGARIAACGDGVDAGAGFAEIVGGEMGERFVEARGVRGRAAEREAEGQ